MPVTTTIDFSKPLKKGRRYPYIGILSSADDGDLIVLFSSTNSGTVLNAVEGGFAVGTHSNGYNEAQFAVLQLPLIMENE